MKLSWMLLLWTLPGLAAAPSLPSYLSLPAGVHVSDGVVSEEEYGEAEFKIGAEGEPVVKHGRHWNAAMTFDGLPEETEDNEVWARIRAALLAGSWTIVDEYDANPYHATFRYQKGGKDSWGFLWVHAPSDLRLDVVEIGPQPMKFALKAPAAQPEKMAAESGDFPYLAPLPGSRASGGQKVDTPMTVTLPGSEEAEVVGSGFLVREYVRPGLSNLQFATVYRDALKAAGWTIVVDAQGVNQSDAALTAHYAANGRNLWAYLHHGGGEYRLQVADAGAADLAAQLKRDCRVPLYGVLFDFNQATLKPESEAVLAQARDALKASPALAVEVQGHTDNVGSDAYNLKLSEARAGSVRAWLTAHGIAAAKLTAKGYGRGQPVASNDDAEGRARNRRVELACRR